MMPAGIVPISARRQGEYALLQAAWPGQPAHTIGVYLLDPATGRAYLRLRSRFDDLTDDPEVLEALGDDMQDRAREIGAEAYLQSLEDSLSNVLRITDRTPIAVDSFRRALERLFTEHVEPVAVEPFQTHVPLWSVRAAAGYLSDEATPEAEDWVPAPEGKRLTRDMFVAHVEGASMEPLIPDGSLNLFRYGVAGSRQGKVVLIERFGVDQAARYSVKRYTSTKIFRGDDDWEHGDITFVPVNHEFEPWSPAPGEFRIIAEWLGTVE
jgi:hypothetical protein